MATRNIVFGSTDSNNEIDVIDIVAIIALPNMASLLFGVFSWNIEVFGGYDFTAPLWTMFGADISLALLIAVFSLLWIAGTNLANRKTDMGQWEFGVLVTALALPVLYALVPSVENLVMYHDLAQVAALIYVAVAAVYVSYEG